MVTCKSCGQSFSWEELIKNGYICPKCGQKVNYDPDLLKKYMEQLQKQR